MDFEKKKKIVIVLNRFRGDHCIALKHTLTLNCRMDNWPQRLHHANWLTEQMDMMR